LYPIVTVVSAPLDTDAITSYFTDGAYVLLLHSSLLIVTVDLILVTLTVNCPGTTA
jgi:hypothetical protein